MSPLPSSTPACPSAFAVALGRVAVAVTVAAGLWEMVPSAAQAQAGPSQAMADAEQYNAATTAALELFNAGKWSEAGASFEAALKLVKDEKSPQIPLLLYMAGASYFNGQEFDKAADVFKKYLEKAPPYGTPGGEKVMEVKLALARSYLRAKKYDEAATAFLEFEAVPALRDEAMNSAAYAYKEADKPDLAIAVLERLITPEIKSVAQATGAVMLLELYADKKEEKAWAKAVVLLKTLAVKTWLIENPVGLNALAVRLGDEFLDEKKFADALTAYRAVRPYDDVMKFQRRRIAATEAMIEKNTKAGTVNPLVKPAMEMENMRLKDLLTEWKKTLTEFEKVPDYGPALLLRQARVYYEWEKRWEAIVVYRKLPQRYPEAKERESALFGEVACFSDLQQAKLTQQACDKYLKEFKDGPNAGTVGYLAGAVALQTQDYKGAEKQFERMLEQYPKSDYKEDMMVQLGNARFLQGKLPEALKDYEKYVAEYPAGGQLEEVSYRIALCTVFRGEYENGEKLLKAYLAKYPQGVMAGDGHYRVMVCRYAASEYEEVIKDAEGWLKEYAGKLPVEGEVHSLVGDCYAAQNKLVEAVAAYQRAIKTAPSDEVLNYALFEASKHLQKLGKWKEVSAMFEGFVRDKPDHSTVVTAMYWIGKARAKEGKLEEAKAIMVENLKKYIAEPKREGVELLLQQLAQFCWKRPRPPAPPPAATPAPVVAVEKGAAPVPATPAPPPELPPVLPPYYPNAELAKQLAPLDDSTNITTKARLLYAKIELAKLLKKPDEADKMYQEMASRFKPEDLSPYLLAQVGDFLKFRGDTEKAAAYYTKLREDFPKSDYLDYAYVGLGEIALGKKEYAEALELFTDALDKIGATAKLKEATIGKGKALLALKQYPAARKVFEQVQSVREWRGESTAEAVYSLAEIELAQYKYLEAIAYYRRVFVAYQKYLPWVAKAYLGAAETFEKLGKRNDAVANLREMLRNEKLAKFPEAEVARKRLAEWGDAS